MDQGASEQALQRELEATREREAAYRDWLSQTAERTQRLRKHTAALLETLGKRPPKQRDLMRTLTDTARISSIALGVARTSLWLFDPAGSAMQCKLMLAGEGVEPTLNSIIPVSASPEYFRAISTTGVVAVENVREDPRTAGLEAYLAQHDVAALLDISIAIPGELMGVVCHEHVGGPRAWHPEEVDFATHVSNMIALALEVERRQLAEAKAVSAEARYRYLVESLPVTVYSFDPYSRRIDYLSPQIRELGTLDGEELLRDGVDGWLAAVLEEDRARVEARFKPHGVDASPAEIQYRIRVDDGVRYVRDQCRVVRNHAGEPVAIQGVLADVTEQHKSQQRAAEFERRLRTLLECVDLLAIVIDARGRLEFVNECFERTTGYESAMALGRDVFALLAAPAEAAGLLERYTSDLARGVVPGRFENEIVTRSGERRRIVWTGVLLRADGGKTQGACSLGLDITERVNRETELLQQTKLESLGQLSAGVAHDFNNLLTVMGVQSDFLARSHPDARAQGAVEVLKQSLAQAGELTRSLLVYARREPVSPSVVDVDSLIEEMTPLLTTLAGRGVQVDTALHAHGVHVLIDRAQLRQLILNFTTNAVDATEGHGKQVIISTAIELVERAAPHEPGTMRADRYVAIAVTDDGRGMDERTQARVFEPFFTTKQSGKGTGLGLAMCQSIVARAGGFIRVQSEVGRGTTCRAYLPVVPEPRAREPADRTSLPEGEAMRVTSALVVEDEPLVRRLLLATLEELSLRVHSAATIAEATRIASSEQIDLLVTDGALPDGSGRTLARSARAARPQLRVLLVSGAPEDGHEFDATLHKPFTRERLLAAVKRLLDRE